MSGGNQRQAQGVITWIGQVLGARAPVADGGAAGSSPTDDFETLALSDAEEPFEAVVAPAAEAEAAATAEPAGFEDGDVDWKMEEWFADLLADGDQLAELKALENDRGTVIDADELGGAIEVIGEAEALQALRRSGDRQPSAYQRAALNAGSRVRRAVTGVAADAASMLTAPSTSARLEADAPVHVETAIDVAQADPARSRYDEARKAMGQLLGRRSDDRGFTLVADDIASVDDDAAGGGRFAAAAKPKDPTALRAWRNEQAEALRAWEKEQAGYQAQMQRYNLLAEQYGKRSSGQGDAATRWDGVRRHLFTGFSPGQLVAVAAKVAGAAANPASLLTGQKDQVTAWGDVTNTMEVNVNRAYDGAKAVSKAIKDDVQGNLQILDASLIRSMGIALRGQPQDVRRTVEKANAQIQRAIIDLAGGTREQLVKEEERILGLMKERQKIPCMPKSMQTVTVSPEKLRQIEDVADRAGDYGHIVREQVLRIYKGCAHDAELRQNIIQRNVTAKYPRQGMMMLTHGKPGTGKSSLVIEIAKLTGLPTIKVNAPPEKPRVQPAPNAPLQNDKLTPAEIVKYLKVALRDAMAQTGCFNCIAELEEADYLTDPAFSESPEAKQFFDNNGCGLEPFDPEGNANDGGMLVPYYGINIVANTNHNPTGGAFMQRWAIVEMKDLKPEEKAKAVKARYEALLDDPTESVIYAAYGQGYKAFALKVFEAHDVPGLIEQARGGRPNTEGFRIVEEVLRQVIPEILKARQAGAEEYTPDAAFGDRLRAIIETTFASKAAAHDAGPAQPAAPGPMPGPVIPPPPPGWRPAQWSDQ